MIGANAVARYVIVIVDAFAVIAVTWGYCPTSFQKTPVVERMQLLTLIIMGEGVIGITKSVTTLFLGAKRASVSDFVTITSAVLLIVSRYRQPFAGCTNEKVLHLHTLSRCYRARKHGLLPLACVDAAPLLASSCIAADRRRGPNSDPMEHQQEIRN